MHRIILAASSLPALTAPSVALAQVDGFDLVIDQEGSGIAKEITQK
ncbi:hypothetical protein [uncultured Erythrobacter sp.]|nr:hypothetical protein [uncultured Erythrobacter sp.]